ncbi:hypothetical protein HDU76_003227 [Blyttiomyces sp. JEL0837]|nr:hypothetical protein HDU76_003227 [Blyttiomyces sp. JEL0837]
MKSSTSLPIITLLLATLTTLTPHHASPVPQLPPPQPGTRGSKCPFDTSPPTTDPQIQPCNKNLTCSSLGRTASEDDTQYGNCVPVSPHGGPCGGFIMYPPVCDAGLTCIRPSNRPSDLPGTCAGVSMNGEACGDAESVCDVGLTCVVPTGIGNSTGVCMSVGKRGDPCGGSTQKCDVGLSCVPSTNPEHKSGICRSVVGVNDFCGGNMVASPVCKDGLTCWSTDLLIGDVGGVCKKVVVLGGKCVVGANTTVSEEVCAMGLKCVVSLGDPSCGVCVDGGSSSSSSSAAAAGPTASADYVDFSTGFASSTWLW